MRDLVDELLQAKVKTRLFGGDHAPRLGRLVILDQIGSGAMGTVFAAYDPRLDRKVAVKVVKSLGGGETAQVLREARALGKLAHPNVVAVHDASRVDDAIYIVMELAPGIPLRAWIGGDHDWREVVRVMREAAAGIAAAHRAGLVHRDIKPDNILLGNDRPRVVDFGLAHDRRGDRETTNAGTPIYMAPEVLAGGDATEAADQFSFGVTLYEALYGERPHSGTTREELREAARFAEKARPGATRSRRDAKTPAPPVVNAAPARGAAADADAATARDAESAERAPAAKGATATVEAGPERRSARSHPPAWVHAIAARALAADPAQRFASMDEVVAALGRDRRRQRGLAIAAAALVVGAIGGVLAYRARATPGDACGGADARIAAAWTPTTAERVRAALGGTPWARTAVDALDRHAHAWTTSYRHVCEATRVRGEQSDTLLDLRMRCLDRGLDRLASLASALAGPLDAATRAEASTAIVSLPPTATCEAVTDPGELALPEDPAQRARVIAAERELDRASTAFALARYRDARTTVVTVETETQGLDVPALRAQVAFLAGSIEARIGDATVARTRLHAALRDAATAHATELELDVWSRLLRHELFSGNPGAVVDDAPFALAAAARAGREGADIDGVVGEALRDEGQLGPAREHLLRALASHDPLRADQRALLEMNVGSVALAAGDPAAAEAAFTRAFELAHGLLGDGHPSLALYLDKLAAVDRARGRLRAAFERHAQSLGLRRAAFGERDRSVATSLLQRARTEIEAGQLAAATTDLTDARAIRVQSFGETSPRLGEIEQALGDAMLAAGNAADARVHFERAAALDRRLDLVARLSAAGAPVPQTSFPTTIDPLSVDRTAALAARIAWLPHDHAVQVASALRVRWQAAGGGVDANLSLSVAEALLSTGDRAAATLAARAALRQLADEPSRARLRALTLISRGADGDAAHTAAEEAAALAAQLPELAR